jgi:hypothetical protein
MKDGVFNKKQTLKYTKGYANEAPASLVTEVAPQSPTGALGGGAGAAAQRTESPARSASPSSPLPKWVELDKKVRAARRWRWRCSCRRCWARR